MSTSPPNGERKLIPPANAPPVSAQTRMVVMLAAAMLMPRKDNREVTAEDVTKSGLLASIEARGVLVPLLVRKLSELYEVVAGHRRLFCLKLLGRDKAPCIVLEGDVSDAQVIEVGFAENVLRKAKSPVEQAEDIMRYMKLTGCTQIEAGERLHLSQGTISRILNRHLYSPELCKHVDSFQIVPSAADAIFKLGDPELEAQAIQYALSTPKPSRDDIKLFCDRLKGKKDKKPKALRVKDGRRRLTIDLLPTDTHDGLIEILKGIIARINKAQKDGIELKHLSVLFNGGAS